MTAATGFSKHLSGLPGEIQTVATQGFRKTMFVVEQAIDNNEIAVVFGAAGLGKTFAVDHTIRSATMECLWVQVGPSPSPKEVTSRLLHTITGKWPKGPQYELTDHLVELLVDEPRIVVIDEAQHFGKQGLEQIRFLHDKADGRFPLILIGGKSLHKVIRSNAQLADRVGGWVRFETIGGPNLHSILDAYHPVFRNTQRQLLDAIDREYGRGVFRKWARVLKECLPLVEASDSPDRITQDVAGRVLPRLTV